MFIEPRSLTHIWIEQHVLDFAQPKETALKVNSVYKHFAALRRYLAPGRKEMQTRTFYEEKFACNPRSLALIYSGSACSVSLSADPPPAQTLLNS